MSAESVKLRDLWFPASPTWPESWWSESWWRGLVREAPVLSVAALPQGSRLAVENELVERCRLGDPDAFDRLFEQTKDHIYTLALHFSGDEGMAADVTQEVYLKLLDRIGQFRRDAEFSTWLYRVVLNTFLDYRRSRKPWVPLDEPAHLDAPPPELVLQATQEADATRLREARLVRRAVAELRPHWRSLVVLRYGAGLSYEEIAEVLEISPGTVASRLSRAHARLAKKLAQLGPG